MYRKKTESQQDNSICTNCQILNKQISDLQGAVQIKDIQFFEFQNNVMRICVNSKAETSYGPGQELKQKSFVPDIRPIEHELQDREAIVKRRL